MWVFITRTDDFVFFLVVRREEICIYIPMLPQDKKEKEV
jgi:hypothetical protein